MEYMAILIAFAGGFCLPIQTAINSQLDARWSHHTVLTSAVSFGVGFLCLAAYVLLARVPVPSFPGQTSPWHWFGGALGAFYVSAMLLAFPRLGAASTISLSIAGQMCLSLLLDYYGLIGLAERGLSWQRLVGVAMVIGGVILVRKF